MRIRQRASIVLLLATVFLPELGWSLQQAPPAASALRDAQTLGWRVGIATVSYTRSTFLEAAGVSASLGLKFVEGNYRQRASGDAAKNLDPSLSAAERKALLDKLTSPGIGIPVYFASFPRDEAGCRALFDFARQFGVETIVAEPEADALDLIEKLANEYGINVAIHNRTRDLTPAYWDPAGLLKLIEKRGPRIGACGDLAHWMRSGIKPIDALRLLKSRLLTLHVHDFSEFSPGGHDVVWGTGAAALEDFIKEVYRLELRPTLWSVDYASQAADPTPEIARSLEFFNRTILPIASYQRDYVSRTKGVRRLAEVTAEEHRLIEAALPEKALATPGKPRKLLIVDTNLGRGGHPSIPYANLAVELMGKKTGAFETVVSHDTSMLEPDKLRQFDALYLNNTAGDLFDTQAKRDGLVAFLREGGGLLGNHATTITSPDWSEFGEILGARGASHRMTDEKVIVKLDDSLSPINAAFAGRSFEFSDEIFRFEPPYSRQQVHVLMSIDIEKTDLNQGRCFGKCFRDDNDYAIAWIHEYGKGRVFHSTFGHSPSVFWDPRILEHWLAAIQYALGDLDPRPSGVENVLARLAAYSYGGSSAAVGDLDVRIAAAAGIASELRKIERSLLDFLASNASTAGKDVACRHLSLIGTETSVPTLAKMLDAPELAGMALYALQRIPGPAVDEALRKAMAAASGSIKIGLINSLGARADTRAVPVLKPLINNPDLQIGAAAAAALGNIADAPAAAALAEARKKPVSALRSQILESSLACAARLAERGDRKAAESIYRELSDSGQPALIRIGALEGMTRLVGKDSTPLLLKAIRGMDARVRDSAINLIASLAGAEVTALLVNELSRQPMDGRVRVLYALGRRPDPAAREALRNAAGASEEALRIASLDGLGKIGTGEDILLLAERAAAAKGAEQSTARESLYCLRSPDADRAVLAGIAKAEPKAKLELIRACGKRATSSCAEVLLATARDADLDIRRESFRALRQTAGKPHITSLVDLMDSTADASDRSEAGRALASALRRAANEGATELIMRYSSSSAATKKAALLEVMGQAGTSELLPTVRAALKEGDLELRRAAILAATAWSTPAPLPDLLEAARTDPSPPHRILALRGVLRLLTLPSQRSTAETAGLLTQSMSLATQADEKKAILALAPRFPHAETLALAEAAMNDATVAGEAKMAAERIRKALGTAK